MEIATTGPGFIPPPITRTAGSTATKTPPSAEESEETPGEPQSRNGAGANSQELDEKQRAQVETLKTRDREVRAHEAAHKAAAGGLARGAASFSYQTGPDKQRYAVGGEVSIDTSPGNTPRETLQKAQTIRAAALAPAKPSQQDRSVAASATQMAAEAQSKIAVEKSLRDNDTSPASQARAVENYTRTAAADPQGRATGGIDFVI